MLKSAEATDWLASAEQQAWFDRFKANDVQGIKFNQFQEFLKATIYTYFAKSSPKFQRINNNNQINQSQPESEGVENHKNVEDKTLRFSYQQEMLLFKVFDLKNDHYIDRDEFGLMCQNWLEKTYRRSCALVVVDVQNDFIDGSLALINGPAGQDGADVVPVINSLLDKCSFDLVAYTQDWHPQDHIGFYDNLHLRKYAMKGKHGDYTKTKDNILALSEVSSTNGSTATGIGDNANARFKLKRLTSDAKMFDTVLFDEGRMEQKLWPIHCVQNSWGAELHPKLKIVSNLVKIYKGTLSHVDAYSAFWDNMRMNETGLRQELISRKISDVFFCGLALDYCVAASALDAARAGFTTFVIEDACRGIDEEEMSKRKEEMLENGILIVKSEAVNSYLTQIRESQIMKRSNYTDQQDKLVPKSNIIINIDESGLSSRMNHTSTQTPSSPHYFDTTLLVDICFKRALALSA